MHFKEIPCSFGKTTSKTNAKDITISDFEELKNQLEFYKDESTHAFRNVFCEPVLDELRAFMSGCKSMYEETSIIYKINYNNREKLKKVIERIKKSGDKYLAEELNDKGKIKIQHRVSKQRVDQVRKLKAICKDIELEIEKTEAREKRDTAALKKTEAQKKANVEARKAREARVRKQMETETQEIKKITEEAERIVNDTKNKDPDALFAMGLSKSCRELAKKVRDVCCYQTSSFYKTILYVWTQFQWIENHVKKRAELEDTDTHRCVKWSCYDIRIRFSDCLQSMLGKQVEGFEPDEMVIVYDPAGSREKVKHARVDFIWAMLELINPIEKMLGCSDGKD